MTCALEAVEGCRIRVVEMLVVLSCFTPFPGMATVGALSPWWWPNPALQCFLTAPRLVVKVSGHKMVCSSTFLFSLKQNSESACQPMGEAGSPLLSDKFQVHGFRCWLFPLIRGGWGPKVLSSPHSLSWGTWQGRMASQGLATIHQQVLASSRKPWVSGSSPLWSGQRILLPGDQNPWLRAAGVTVLIYKLVIWPTLWSKTTWILFCKMQHKWISGGTTWKEVQRHTQYKLWFFVIRFNRYGQVVVNVSRCSLHISGLFWLWPCCKAFAEPWHRTVQCGWRSVKPDLWGVDPWLGFFKGPLPLTLHSPCTHPHLPPWVHISG